MQLGLLLASIAAAVLAAEGTDLLSPTFLLFNWGEPQLYQGQDIMVPLLYQSSDAITYFDFLINAEPLGVVQGAAVDAGFEFTSVLTIAAFGQYRLNGTGSNTSFVSGSTIFDEFAGIVVSRDRDQTVFCVQTSNGNVLGFPPIEFPIEFANQACIFLELECIDSLIGDITKDGILTITDIIIMITGVTQGTNAAGNAFPSECDLNAADITGDGSVNIADVISVRNLILGLT